VNKNYHRAAITRSTKTVHTLAKAHLTSVAIRIRIDPDPWSGSPPKLYRSFIGLLPNLLENIMQIRSKVFAQSCQQANTHTDSQTDKQRRLHILLGGGNKTLSPVYTIQPVVTPVVKLVWQPVWQTAVSCIQPVVKPGCTTRFSNRVQPGFQTGFYNPVSQPVERIVAVRSTWLSNHVCQTGCTTRFDNRLNEQCCSFDNRLDVCLHDTTGCQNGSCKRGFSNERNML